MNEIDEMRKQLTEATIIADACIDALDEIITFIAPEFIPEEAKLVLRSGLRWRKKREKGVRRK